MVYHHRRASGLCPLCISEVHKREKELRSFAEVEGYTYAGRSLKSPLSMGETLIRKAHSTENWMTSDRGGKEILVFDCALGSGKSRQPQTIIAVRGTPANPALFGIGPDRTVEKAGEWTLVCHRGLMSVDQIRDCLSDL